ncbi:MAG: DUF354 domain-containing protein [Thermoplasmata archaeon]
MKLLVVIGHPAHVHFFRHFIAGMEDKGHQCMVCVKVRENTTRLLELFEIPYNIFGKTYNNIPTKAWGVVMNDLRLIQLARRFKPDLTASIAGLYSVHAGACLGVPSIDFMDTEGAKLTNGLTFPFATVIATPDCYKAPVPENKHRKYPGYHELAYLHPDRFQPNPSIIDELGLKVGEYIVVRLSSLDASHQKKEGVMSRDDKIRLVEKLMSLGDVVVDSEYTLPRGLREYGLEVQEHQYHHVLAHAALYVGEGATAASEAGVLGTPWIYISKRSRCYLKDQENNYGLGRRVSTLPKAYPCWTRRCARRTKKPVSSGTWSSR